MPELPEVEVIRRDLEREIVGKKIKSVEVDAACARCAATTTASSSSSRLVGKKITSVERRGKYLLVKLDDEDVLVIHLGMSGQLLRAKSTEEPIGQAHARGRSRSPRAGSCVSSTRARSARCSSPSSTRSRRRSTELAHLGLDPLETAMSWDVLRRAARRSATRKLKPVLMDQKFIAGIGNIYSDEILCQAGLRWDRMSDSSPPRRSGGCTGRWSRCCRRR